MLGWIYQVPILMHPILGPATTKANAALAICMAAIATLLLSKQQEQPEKRAFSFYTRLLVFAISIIALATLSEIFFGLNLGIDQALAIDISAQINHTHPGRMGPNTAMALLAYSGSLLCASSGRKILQNVSAVLALLVLAIAAFALIGYLYDMPLFYRISRFTEMSITSAICVFSLTVGFLCLFTDKGPLAVLSQDTPPGYLARRLIPFGISLPLIFGWIIMRGEESGLYPIEFGVAILASAMSVLLTLSTYWITRVLSRADEVRKEAESLSAELKSAQLARQRMSEFYSTVSHELRTPFASIRAGLGILELSKNDLPPSITEVVKVSKQECDRLTNLINDFLDLSKIEAGSMQLQMGSCALEDLLIDAVSSIQYLAAEKNISISKRLEANCELICDGELIHQVLVNLLSNAIKFSPPESTVSLSAKCLESKVLFKIQDMGPGIPAESRSKMFSRFFRVRKDTEENQSGTGLGLAISKAIVDQHGGKIDFENAAEKGTTFWFELPSGQCTEG
ncbi:MAG: HAMP domain-containing histidine kinase [Candidatus Obscuribacterales bacterium]|nr:HAMP domain-containing histidine kinase [Candidatus Obscuribacterales bacterium]